MSQPIAFVTGATGVLGTALVPLLRERGYAVRALVRAGPALVTPPTPPSQGGENKSAGGPDSGRLLSGSQGRHITQASKSEGIGWMLRGNPDSELLLSGPPAECITGDLADEAALRKGTAGAEVVFHLAAKLHGASEAEQDLLEYTRVNVEGTRRVLEAARAEGVRRVVFFSTIAVYGPGAPGRVFLEDGTVAPATPYPRTKLEAEKLVLDYAGPGGQGSRGVVLRLAAVYGPHMKGNYPRLVRAIQRGRFVRIGDGQNRRTLIHEQDAARAAVLAAEHPEAGGKIFNVTDGAVHTLNEILAAIAAASGRRVPKWGVPAGLARAGLGVLEVVAQPFGSTLSSPS